MVTDRIAAEYGSINRIRQVAPACANSNTWFLAPTRGNTPVGISIGPATFARHTSVSNTDTPTRNPNVIWEEPRRRRSRREWTRLLRVLAAQCSLQTSQITHPRVRYLTPHYHILAIRYIAA